MQTNRLNNVFRETNAVLLSIEGMTRGVIGKFDNLSREAELSKLGILARALENKRMSQANRQGFAAIKKDNRKLVMGLALAFGESLLQGAISKDNSVVLPAGISGFNAFLQGLGDSQWAVSLDRQFIVVPKDEAFASRIWVTLESLRSAIEELRQKTLGGEELGNLESIIEKLKQGRSKLVYVIMPVSTISEETYLGPWHRVTE